MTGTSPVRRLLAAALTALTLVVLAMVPSADAASARKQFSVDVTGIHQVDWTYRDPGAGEECRTWSRGSGSQTIGFSTPRPGRYTLTVVDPRLRSRLPEGTPAAMWLALRAGTVKAVARRTPRGWKDHVPPGRCTPCDQEGGCDGPPADLPAPPAPASECPRRAVKHAQVVATYFPDGDVPGDDELLAPLGPAFGVQAVVPIADLYRRCLPDAHAGLRIVTPEPVLAAARNVFGLERLRAGRTLRLHATAERFTVAAPGGAATTTDVCPKRLDGDGYRECAVTDVTIAVRRLR
jgi:hypothetical protein